MKITGFLLSMFFWLSLSVSANANLHTVTLEEALHVAEREFIGEDVDYYVLNNNSTIAWSIFVDAEPMKGWEHNCYLLVIPKTCVSLDELCVNRIQRRLPPSEDYIPLSVKNRYASNALIRPFVSSLPQANELNEAANRTYAIIISGGVNPIFNYERYRNDCSFIYQTLTKKYGIPKSNIFPIMSDGENPDADMHTTTGHYASQSLDLDFDNCDETIYAATKQNIQNRLNVLSSQLNEDDHLFIFVIDHGGTDDYESESYICLWNNEKLYDHELASLLTPLSNNYVNINVVLGQCFAGGFVDDLTQVGCVVSAACSGSESSWACSDIPFDEFVYQWTCAVNQADHSGVSVISDTDNNNRVTIDEAFDFAKNHDRVMAEHPQYMSTPLSVGEDLAFNHLAPAVDIYVKDNFEDTGKEPNMTTDKFWLSPSIWVRNNNDSIEIHENPYYAQNHMNAAVYVRIYNRGKKAYSGGDYVHVYWTKASTAMTKASWKGYEEYNGHVTGEYLRAQAIPRIEPGQSQFVVTNWSLPIDMMSTSSDQEEHHFCLLARIMSTYYDDSLPAGISYFDVKGSNKIAQKNVSVVYRTNLASITNVFVRNITDETQPYTLELVPHTPSDSLIYSVAEIEMTLAQPILTAWAAGGYRGNSIHHPNQHEMYRVTFDSPESRLEAISLAGREFDKVGLKFNFRQGSFSPKRYTLDLIQKDTNGNIMGGETFIVEEPRMSSNEIEVEETVLGNGTIRLSTNQQDAVETRWLDNNNSTIGTGNTIILPFRQQHRTITAVSLSSTGELTTKRINQ